jgi:hypothetical protein
MYAEVLMYLISKGSRDLEAYCKGSLGPTRAVVPPMKKKKNITKTQIDSPSSKTIQGTKRNFLRIRTR